MSEYDEPDRLISGERHIEDVDAALRPKSLSEFIGQEKARDNLAVFIKAAKARGDALDHLLFFWPFRPWQDNIGANYRPRNGSEFSRNLRPCHRKIR